jgi:trans-aconitate methyltransferase
MNRRVENWDPAQYGKFAAERMRPVEDLLAP